MVIWKNIVQNISLLVGVTAPVKCSLYDFNLVERKHHHNGFWPLLWSFHSCLESNQLKRIEWQSCILYCQPYSIHSGLHILFWVDNLIKIKYNVSYSMHWIRHNITLTMLSISLLDYEKKFTHRIKDSGTTNFIYFNAMDENTSELKK